MKIFHSLTFRIIMLSITGVLITTIALVTSVVLSENKTEEILLQNKIQLEEQSKLYMKPIVMGFYNSVRIHDKMLLSRLNSSLAYMRTRLQAKELSSVVDDVSKIYGINATIFHKLEDGSMKIIYTSIVGDGEIAVNTRIYPKNDDGSPNAMLQSVLKGNKYVGRAIVNGEVVNAIYEPIIEEGKVTGMLFVNSLVADMKDLLEVLKSLNYGINGSIFAIGIKGVRRGNIYMSVGGNLERKNVWDVTNSNGENYWRKVIEIGSSLPENTTEYLEVDHEDDNGQTYKLSIVEMYYAPWDVVIGVSIPKEEIEKLSNEIHNSLYDSMVTLKRQVYLTGIVTFVLLLIISLIFSKNLTRIIKHSIVLFDKISKGDMTNRLEMAKGDLGKMARHFNRLMDNMHEFIKKVTNDTLNLNSVSKELFSVSGQVEDVSDKIVMRSNMIASTTEQMVVIINVIASTIERMSTNMNNIAVSMKDMNLTINKITNNVDEIHKITVGAKNKVANATVVMNSLGAAAKEIGDVTEMIKRIAEKTNILALNATIEAAYAGDAGKGFAVVAAEIKELANQSANSANYITQRIESIQDGTDNAVNVIHDVSNIIVKIGNSVEVITGSNNKKPEGFAISSSAEQTNATVRYVYETINEIAKHSGEVSRNVNEVAKGIVNVNSSVSNMNLIAEEIKKGSTKVHQKSKDLENIATELKEMFKSYKI